MMLVLQTMYFKGIEAGKVPYFPHADTIIYSISIENREPGFGQSRKQEPRSSLAGFTEGFPEA